MAVRSRQLCLHPKVNLGKTHELERLAAEYRAYLQVCCGTLVEARLLRPSRTQYRGACPESAMSSALTETCREHAAGMVSSWSAGIYGRRVKQHISRLKREGQITDEAAHARYRIGKYGIGAPKGPVTQQDIDAYWAILSDPKVGGRTPRVSHKVGTPDGTSIALNACGESV